MQLPRGTFREIRKSETIGEILTELERTKFSGICSISSGSGTGTLVLKSGKCILVKFHGKSGDTGWDKLQKNLFEEVDAALSSLDEAQVQLSLEFNKACRLVRGGGKSAQVAAEPQKSSPPLREPVKKPAPRPGATMPPVFRPAPPSHPAASPEPQPQKVQPLFQRPAMPAPPCSRHRSGRQKRSGQPRPRTPRTPEEPAAALRRTSTPWTMITSRIRSAMTARP